MTYFKKPEILAPCGSYEILIAAINAGADACYFGGNKFGARAYATNFDLETSIKAIQYAHIHGVKLYLTVNTLFKENEIKELYDFILPYYEAGLDAVIVQDLGVFKLVKDMFPDINIHCSTQMNITSKYAAKAMSEMGASRIVTAREMSLEEIAEIKKNNNIEIESFVHGAMCYSYSGRCLMSSLAGGRSGNRGRCAQPCRKAYDSEYILSMKDMCTLTDVLKLIEAGIDSLKIEGRMKNEYYVASAVDAYKQISEDVVNGCYSEKKAEKLKFKLANIYNRGGFCGGYYFMHNGPDMISKKRPNNQGIAIGRVENIKAGQIGIRLDFDLNKQDVIELKLKDESIIEITSGVEGLKGQLIYLNAPKTKHIIIGQTALRTRSNNIIRHIQDDIINNQPKYGLYGSLKAKVGEKLFLTLRRQMLDKQYEITCYGDVVDKTNSKEANLDDIKSKISMLGNTCYSMDQLDMEVDKDAFIPASVIKRLRREAIDVLDNEIINSFTRKIGSFVDNNILLNSSNVVYPQDEAICKVFTIGVTTIEQLSEVVRCQVACTLVMTTELYNKAIQCDVLDNCKGSDFKIYIELPYVVNNSFKLQNYLPKGPIDGIYIRNIDGMFAYLEYLKSNLDCNNKLSVICGDGLYAYNTHSRNLIRQLLPEVCFELPKELNREDLRPLCDGNNQLVCYEYQQVMLSAQCVVKNTTGCNKSGDIVKLKDDMKNVFYARANCKECNNVIYNGIPYMILDQLDEEYLQSLNVSSLRVNFTVEDEMMTKEILDVIQLYKAGENVSSYIKNMKATFTSGHFNRGV